MIEIEVAYDIIPDGDTFSIIMVHNKARVSGFDSKHDAGEWLLAYLFNVQRGNLMAQQDERARREMMRERKKEADREFRALAALALEDSVDKKTN